MYRRAGSKTREVLATDGHRYTQMECPGAVPFEGRSRPQADACLARDGQGCAAPGSLGPSELGPAPRLAHGPTAETGNQHFVIWRKIRGYSRYQSEPVACGRGGAGVQTRLKSRTRTKTIPAVTAGTREACHRPADLRAITNHTARRQPSVCIHVNLWLIHHAFDLNFCHRGDIHSVTY